jgi:hypothetical protein
MKARRTPWQELLIETLTLEVRSGSCVDEDAFACHKSSLAAAVDSVGGWQSSPATISGLLSTAGWGHSPVWMR